MSRHWKTNRERPRPRPAFFQTFDAYLNNNYADNFRLLKNRVRNKIARLLRGYPMRKISALDAFYRCLEIGPKLKILTDKRTYHFPVTGGNRKTVFIHQIGRRSASQIIYLLQQFVALFQQMVVS